MPIPGSFRDDYIQYTISPIFFRKIQLYSGHQYCAIRHQPCVFDRTSICVELTGISSIIFFQCNFIPIKCFVILYQLCKHVKLCITFVFPSHKKSNMCRFTSIIRLDMFSFQLTRIKTFECWQKRF
jgi:hypothetical protein